MPHGEEGHWKEIRSIANSAFKLSSLRAMHSIFTRHSISFAQKLLDLANRNGSTEFADEISKLTLDIISSAGFGFSLGASFNMGLQSPLLQAINHILLQGRNPLLLLNGVWLIKFMVRNQMDVLDQTFYGIIDERIKEQQEGKKNSGRTQDLLDMLLQPGEDGRQLTREEIRDELFLFYFAGHETTANALSWTIYELSRNPDVAERLVQEIESVMGPHKGGDPQAPTVAQLDEMPYMTMVLNEVLRCVCCENNFPATGVGRHSQDL